MTQKLMVGTDAEVFLTNPTGKFIASCGKFGGTKEVPLQMPKLPSGFALQEDNVALEFNIPPAADQWSFSHNVHAALAECQRQASDKGLIVQVKASAEFEEDQLRSRKAREFGCEADYNVWALKENPRPRSDNPALRTAAAHVHIGGFTEDNIGLGRACDLFLGCPSVALDPDKKRRELYGKAGAIRMKPYGIEYRTISNFWITGLSTWVFVSAMRAVDFVKNGWTIPDEDGRKIIKCINDFDVELLKELTSKYRIQY